MARRASRSRATRRPARRPRRRLHRRPPPRSAQRCHRFRRPGRTDRSRAAAAGQLPPAGRRRARCTTSTPPTAANRFEYRGPGARNLCAFASTPARRRRLFEGADDTGSPATASGSFAGRGRAVRAGAQTAGTESPRAVAGRPEGLDRPAGRMAADLQRVVADGARLLLRAGHARARLARHARALPRPAGAGHLPARTWCTSSASSSANSTRRTPTWAAAPSSARPRRSAVGMLGADYELDAASGATVSGRSSAYPTGPARSSRPWPRWASACARGLPHRRQRRGGARRPRGLRRLPGPRRQAGEDPGQRQAGTGRRPRVHRQAAGLGADPALPRLGGAQPPGRGGGLGRPARLPAPARHLHRLGPRVPQILLRPNPEGGDRRRRPLQRRRPRSGHLPAAPGQAGDLLLDPPLLEGHGDPGRLDPGPPRVPDQPARPARAATNCPTSFRWNGWAP